MNSSITKLTRSLHWLAVAVVLFSTAGPALADQFDNQINAIKQTIAGQQAQINELQGQKNTLAGKVAGLNAQINQTASQIELTQAEADKTAADLAAAKADLEKKKGILDEGLRTLYQQGQTSLLEVLVSSDGFSEFIDKQQSLENVKDKITESIGQITALKAELETKQQVLTAQISESQSLQNDLVSQRNEVANLLASTQGQESAFQSQVAANNQKIASLKAQQAAAIAAASRRIGGGSGCGGYPAVWCNAAQDSRIDDWGMYNRECVSYAAWATEVRFGRYMPYWGGRGNANQWPANARGAGIPVDSSPRVGDVGIYMGGFYGHAMIVESISGGSVIVSSFNADNTGHYSVDEWPTSSLQFIHFR